MPIDLGNIPTGTPPTTGEKLQIRTAIGLGQTDAPTFLKAALSSQGAANAPSLTIGTGAGFYQPTNTVISVSSNGAEVAKFYSLGLILGPKYLGFGETFGSEDTIIQRDAVGILAQRNGTAAQAFRVYNTFPGTTANEWFEINWQATGSNVVKVGVANAGGGGTRGMEINAGLYTNLNVGGVTKFGIGGSQNISYQPLVFNGDNLHDIGASGAGRPKNIYAGTSITAPSITSTNSMSAVDFIRGARLLLGADLVRLSAPSSGVLRLLNDTATSFTRIELGEADMGIMRGTGTPEGAVTAKVGSIFLRTDGGVLSTLYVKESSPTPSTGWVAK